MQEKELINNNKQVEKDRDDVEYQDPKINHLICT